MRNPRQNLALLPEQIQTTFGVQALTLLVVVAVWELIGRTGILFAGLFPPILEILQSLWTYLSTPIMLQHF
jgi:ABC-type nitrate/sulfonate/bicarbonate transport system permease component